MRESVQSTPPFLPSERDYSQVLNCQCPVKQRNNIPLDSGSLAESFTLPHLGSALTGVEREHGWWFHPSVSIESQCFRLSAELAPACS
jgi:hypothetical protein